MQIKSGQVVLWRQLDLHSPATAHPTGIAISGHVFDHGENPLSVGRKAAVRTTRKRAFGKSLALERVDACRCDFGRPARLSTLEVEGGQLVAAPDDQILADDERNRMKDGRNTRLDA